MKKYIIAALTFILLLSGNLYAQRIGELDGIYYQAVAIDEDGKEIVGMDIDGKPLYNKTIQVRFTITSGLNGAIQWQEIHTTNTDKYGLFSLVIGQGELTGEGEYTRMLDMPWIDANQFLMVEIAIHNDDNFRLVSNQRFMSVPYSFYTDDIADDAITTEKILDSAILNQDIHTGAVDSRTILDTTILNEDIRTGSVDTRTILDLTIQNEDIDVGAVDSRTIRDTTIINNDLKTSAVDSRTIKDYTIMNEDIEVGQIDSRTIEDGTILNEDISDGTIDLTSKVTNILPVENGGTETDSLTDGGLLVGGGTGPIRSIDRGVNGQIPVGQTNADPLMKMLAGGRGIKVDETADSVIISYTLTGKVDADGTQSLNIGQIQPGTTYISPAFPVPGASNGALGDIVLASLDKNLQGCILTAYFFSANTIKIAIFNGTGSNVNLGTAVAKLLIVK